MVKYKIFFIHAMLISVPLYLPHPRFLPIFYLKQGIYDEDEIYNEHEVWPFTLVAVCGCVAVGFSVLVFAAPRQESATREARAAQRSLEERRYGVHGVEYKVEGLWMRACEFKV